VAGGAEEPAAAGLRAVAAWRSGLGELGRDILPVVGDKSKKYKLIWYLNLTIS
jgi:hypothetical protein